MGQLILNDPKGGKPSRRVERGGEEKGRGRENVAIVKQ